MPKRTARRVVPLLRDLINKTGGLLSNDWPRLEPLLRRSNPHHAAIVDAACEVVDNLLAELQILCAETRVLNMRPREVRKNKILQEQVLPRAEVVCEALRQLDRGCEEDICMP